MFPSPSSQSRALVSVSRSSPLPPLPRVSFSLLCAPCSPHRPPSRGPWSVSPGPPHSPLCPVFPFPSSVPHVPLTVLPVVPVAGLGQCLQVLPLLQSLLRRCLPLIILLGWHAVPIHSPLRLSAPNTDAVISRQTRYYHLNFYFNFFIYRLQNTY